MDYRFWIIPILLMLLIGGYYFRKKLIILFPWKTKAQKRIYWGILYLILTFLLIHRSIFLLFVGYVIFFNILFDLLGFVLKQCSKESIFKKIYQKGIPILIVSFIILVYGVYNARNPIIKEYEVVLPVQSNYHIGMISDLHLGTIKGEKILKEIVQNANQEQFDLFLLVGDIFDEQTKTKLKEKAYQELSKIQTTYGIYYVEGNHDLLTQEVHDGFTKYGIHVLSDDKKLINEDFYLVGRKDLRREALGTPRKDLKTLLDGIQKPIILVDHQPVEQEQASDLGVSLHLSGHTHAGQIFPMNFLLEYGKTQNEHYTSIVSSGYGAWGFPFRTAGKSEMVSIKVIKKEN